MSSDAYDDRFRLNRQLGIFIKKISRINCYVTSSSTRTSNSSKKIAAQKYFFEKKGFDRRGQPLLSRIDFVEHRVQSLERFKTTD